MFRGLPSNARTVNAEARDNAGRVTLVSLAAWAWNRGIAVVSMAGRGEFSAAVWNGSPRPVIVLKECRELAVYWLFDLAHELAHLALGHVGQAALIDVESPAPRGDSLDWMERTANDFTLEILLPNHEELLQGLLCTPNTLAEEAEYRELCEFAASNGAAYVLMNPLSSMGRGVRARRKLASPAEQMRRITELDQ